jgi:hypothetical protein
VIWGNKLAKKDRVGTSADAGRQEKSARATHKNYALTKISPRYGVLLRDTLNQSRAGVGCLRLASKSFTDEFEICQLEP